MAAQSGQLEVLKYLDAQGVPLDSEASDGSYPLHLAIQGGFLQVVSFFIEKRVNISRPIGQLQNTPLQIAVMKGHPEIAALLRKHGAQHSKDAQGYTSLHMAAKKGLTEEVKTLVLQGIGVDERSNNQETALHCASFHGHADVARILLSAGANVNAQEQGGLSSLHLAAYQGKTDVVEVLLENGADVFHQTPDKQLPIYAATQENHAGICKLILKKITQVQLSELSKSFYERIITIMLVAKHYKVPKDLLKMILSLDSLHTEHTYDLLSGAAHQITKPNFFYQLIRRTASVLGEERALSLLCSHTQTFFEEFLKQTAFRLRSQKAAPGVELVEGQETIALLIADQGEKLAQLCESKTPGFNAMIRQWVVDETPKEAKKLCLACKASGKLVRCGGCRKVYFCNQLCQRNAWEGHKNECKQK